MRRPRAKWLWGRGDQLRKFTAELAMDSRSARSQRCPDFSAGPRTRASDERPGADATLGAQSPRAPGVSRASIDHGGRPRRDRHVFAPRGGARPLPSHDSHRADATRSWHLAPGTPLAVGHARLTLTFPSSFPPTFSSTCTASPPSASHQGHRADSWDVEKWLRAVRVRVTSKGDRGAIKLEDQASGELFAACPLPRDAPVSTVVEPVIDSSRYFVLRVEDEATRRHAFLGLGASATPRPTSSSPCKSTNSKPFARKRRRSREPSTSERWRRRTSARAAEGEESAAKLHDFSLRGSITIAVPGERGGSRRGRERGRGRARKESSAGRTPCAEPRRGASRRSRRHRRRRTTPGLRRGAGGLGARAPAEDDWADFQSEAASEPPSLAGRARRVSRGGRARARARTSRGDERQGETVVRDYVRRSWGMFVRVSVGNVDAFVSVFVGYVLTKVSRV